MGKIDLILADSDAEYIELFKKFIRETDYINSFSVKSFTKPDILSQYLNENRYNHILLINPEIISDNLPVKKIDTIIILTDTISGEKIEDKYQNHPKIYKYQPLNKIISQILSLYNKNENENTSGKKTKVISFFSTTGGSGKTSTALNLAKVLTQRGKKVFYLNFESLNSSGIFLPVSGSYDFSKIIYYLKADNSEIESKLKELIKYDTNSKIEYFEEAAHPQELAELTKEETELLINSIISAGNYDYLLIDNESLIDQRVRGAFLKSTYIIWLVLDDIQYLYKTKKLLNELKVLFADKHSVIQPKIKFVMNKYLGQEPANDLAEFDVNISNFLPYIPQWKAINSTLEIFNQDEFNQGIIKLYNSL